MAEEPGKLFLNYYNRASIEETLVTYSNRPNLAVARSEKTLPPDTMRGD